MKKRAGKKLNPYGYTVTKLWCELYHRYYTAGQYEKADNAYKQLSTVNPVF